MKSIKDIYKNGTRNMGFINLSETPQSERADLVKVFVNRVRNKEGKKYPAAVIAMKLAHVKTDELYYLIDECSKAKSFGALFWYLITKK